MKKNKSTTTDSSEKQVEQYLHRNQKRTNNPQVGLVDMNTDGQEKTKRYRYDPHLAPELTFDNRRSHFDALLLRGLSTESVDEAKEVFAEIKRLQEPFLNWAGKAEKTAFEVPSVSLHVHERLDPKTVIEQIRKSNKGGAESLFANEDRKRPINEAIEFYKHPKNWANRLVAGDSLLVMNSLIEKEGMADKVQMIFFDPPYGISYRSNFQPFVGKRDVSEGDKDEDLTREPESIKAFRDTWELGIHSYLTYMRDRLLLARQLLSDSGSIFVQISDENLHRVKLLLDDVFGPECYVVSIPFKKKGSQKSNLIDPVNDYLLWYGKSPRSSGKIKFRPLYTRLEIDNDLAKTYSLVRLKNGAEFPLAKCPDPKGDLRSYKDDIAQLFKDHPGAQLFASNPLTSGGFRKNQSLSYEFKGKTFDPGSGNCWKTTVVPVKGKYGGMDRLAFADRLLIGKDQIRFKRFLSDFGYQVLSNWWDGLGGASSPVYVVQTNTEVIKRCILMTTDPGDIVLDPTCGSGSTAIVAEQWGRRWITCDTSRVAVAIAKQRLLEQTYDYYKLIDEAEGVRSGFEYKTVPHITLGDIANSVAIDDIVDNYNEKIEKSFRELNKLTGQNYGMINTPDDIDSLSGKAANLASNIMLEVKKMRADIDQVLKDSCPQEVLFDSPKSDPKRIRVTGPFTYEAVPSPVVRSVSDVEAENRFANLSTSIARDGETRRQKDWREQLLSSGIRGKKGLSTNIAFARLDPMSGTRWLQAEGETDESSRVVVSFGPKDSPLEKRQVEMALEEARYLSPKPALLIFASFQFDPEAANAIEKTNYPGIQLLKVQMNIDLLTDDLKKKSYQDDLFWLIGQPELTIKKVKGKHYKVSVDGWDYFDPKKGKIVSGGKSNIAMWMLDTDYDGRSLFPSQVFLPKGNGWGKIAKTLKSSLDQDRVKKLVSTESIEFEAGEYKRIAVKVIDDRGTESLKIVELD